MQSGANSFADYTPSVGGTPDYSWSVAAADSEFGYTVEPETAADAAAAFKDNGSNACNTGSNQNADKCWRDFTTSDVTIINRSSQTDGGGEDEVVKFEAESGSSHFQIEGTYTATITMTTTNN